MNTHAIQIWLLPGGMLGMSLVCFVLMGLDKHRARKHAWRIPEKTLFLVAVLGGAVGGTIGMWCFHHKTRHWYFWAINLLGIAWQAALFGALAYFGV